MAKELGFTLEQSMADDLLRMEKIPDQKEAIEFPCTGGKCYCKLKAKVGNEKFLLDIKQKRICLYYTYQTRAKTSIVLARLDFGHPHQNPDGKIVPAPHLHVYKEGFGDTIAVELPKKFFPNGDDPQKTFDDFVKYCNIIKLPGVNYALF